MRSMPDRATAERTLAHPEAGALFVALQRSALTHVTRRLPGTVTDTTYYQSMPAPPYHRITAPTLAIHGDADPVVPVSHARRVLEAVPHATGLILSGGHTALFSNLDAIRKAVNDFMTRQTP
jgi:pimeloyl-ACP methyl ester carboxylesterase